MFKSVYEAGAKRVQFQTDEYGPLGSSDTLFQCCQYTLYKDDGSVFDQGMYVRLTSFLIRQSVRL